MSASKIQFRKLEEKDWEPVAEIYLQGILTGNATFQQEVPSWEEWDKAHLKTCRLVAELHHKIVAWAALTSVSDRCVYGGVAEVSVYVSSDFSGKNIGTLLLDQLIKESEKNGVWTLQAGVFPENKASCRIHEKLGFRQVGYREKIGKLKGVWRDVLLFERRSKIVGI